MTAKRKSAIVFNTEARHALARGVDQVADLVKMTLGPKGRSIVIEQAMGNPIITRDGVTVAKHINLPDPREDMGARLCREIADQTDELAGDGTTTSIVLAQAIVKGGLSLVEAGADPIRLRQGMQRAVEAVCREIRRLSVAVTPAKVYQVAAIASKSPYIGDLIAKAVNKAGRNGIITVQETIERRSYVQTSKGLELDSGYLSPYFLTEGQQSAVLQKPFVLITDEVIESISQVKRVLNWCSWENRPLLIVANQVTRDALGVLIKHNEAAEGKAIAVHGPGYGQYRLGILEDLAAVTGGSVVAKIFGRTLEHMDKSLLGQAEEIVVTRHKTSVVNGSGGSEMIEGQIGRLKALMRQTSDSEEKGKLQERIARLSGGMAVIFVGADTKMALRELKDRVTDAVRAAKAALEGGVVPGGGTAYLRTAKVLDETQALRWDEAAGIGLIRKVLEAPLRQIAENAGQSGDKIVRLAAGLENGTGYDAMSGKFVDMLEAGIVDPAVVTITALEKAVGIASILLTTEGLVEKRRDGFRESVY